MKVWAFLECPGFKLDLFFVLDGSGSVGEERFYTTKQWVKQVAGNFEIEDGSTKIGIIQYSHFNEKK